MPYEAGRVASVTYEKRRTVWGRNPATRDTLASHYEFGYSRPAPTPRPSLTLDAVYMDAAPRPRTGTLPAVRYNAVTGSRASTEQTSRGEPPALGSTGGLGRTFTSITSTVEESAERDRFRRAHYYPVSQALLQGYSRPGHSMREYHSARELREDMRSHVRPALGPQEKFGYTARPHVSSAEYGWHQPPLPPHPAAPPTPAPPATPNTRPFSQLAVYNGRRLSPMTRYMNAVIRGPR